ncbi:MAG: beta-propeller fold lactonase family protein [Methyloglobulus sp.]
MNKSFRRFSSLFLLATLPLVSAFAATPIGKLYTMSNATTGNKVLVYNRLSDGSLSKTAQVPTAGIGTGGGLGNQGALALSGDGFFLFAVNAGSNSISSFRLTSNGLVLINTVPSGGITPVSLTEDRGRLFVLNAGNGTNPGNIFSFRVNHNGNLSPMAYSERALSSNDASTGAAQISFSDNGKQLIVTEKATDLILTYQVYGYYVSGKPTLNASSGQTPFGFAVGKRNQVFVSNAAGGTPDSSSLSSYRLLPQGQLHVLSPTVATEETAACWVALTPDGRYAFTTNTASGTVSSFRIGMNGKVVLANNDAGITGAGSGPIDMIVGPESRFLYTLNAGTETISSFAVGLDGALTLLTTQTGLPDGANGLIVR